MRSVLSTELFWELIGQNAGGKSPSLLPALCHERWADLAHVLATLPHPVEGALIIANRPEQEPTWNLLTLSRNLVREQAAAQAKRQANELKRIGAD